VNNLHGLLVHQAGDLAKPGWQHIVDALTEARARGWVGRIGASVYDTDQLALVESRFQPQLVQLSLNALDRRAIVSGTLARLKAAGIEVHARSVFLQGLLLMEPSALPNFFAPVRQNISSLHRQWRERGLSALDGCLAFALQRPEVDAIIVGVNRISEFEQIAAAVDSWVGADIDLDANQPVDSMFVDPSRWPAFSH
jgi:aryl-alcohol dehydrogenase-like predicted oxidoreductase